MSPIDVKIGIVDFEFYFSQVDILNNGFGITEEFNHKFVARCSCGRKFQDKS